MIVNPRRGMIVQIWYNKRIAPEMPLHGKIGVVEIVCRPRLSSPVQLITGVRRRGPRNHGVLVGGKIYAVPCGNIRAV